MHFSHHVLDAVDVGHLAGLVYHINIRISVSHKKQLVLPVVKNLRNLVIGQLILAAQRYRLQSSLIKLEQPATIQVVNFVARVIDILDFRCYIIVVYLPSARTGSGHSHHHEHQENYIFFCHIALLDSMINNTQYTDSQGDK